jgi:hypothetical protein|tara:strand:- start:744 stop:1088 length:345 start_codon:yes stop_codon:yes gene_type:complete
MNTDNKILVETQGDKLILREYSFINDESRETARSKLLAVMPEQNRARANLFALAPDLLRAAKCALAALSQPATHKADIALARESLARALNHIELELPIKSMEVLGELERIEKSN